MSAPVKYTLKHFLELPDLPRMLMEVAFTAESYCPDSQTCLLRPRGLCLVRLTGHERAHRARHAKVFELMQSSEVFGRKRSCVRLLFGGSLVAAARTL